MCSCCAVPCRALLRKIGRIWTLQCQVLPEAMVRTRSQISMRGLVLLKWYDNFIPTITLSAAGAQRILCQRISNASVLGLIQFDTDRQVRKVKPHVLLGLSGVGGIFNEEVSISIREPTSFRILMHFSPTLPILIQQSSVYDVSESRKYSQYFDT